MKNCLICKRKLTLFVVLATPDELSIPGDKNFELLLCAQCSCIKKIIDSHISLTSGERHIVKGVKKFISLYEYWSDWTVNMDSVQEDDHNNVNLLKPWNSFSFATGQLNFESKKDALAVMIDYRNEYKKNFHILSFKTYRDILYNVTRALLKQMLPPGKMQLTIVEDPVHGHTKLINWTRYEHVQLFLKEINNYY